MKLFSFFWGLAAFHAVCYGGPVPSNPYDICGNNDGMHLWVANGTANNETAGVAWLRVHDKMNSFIQCQLRVADWNYSTNITRENEDITVVTRRKVAEFEYDAYKKAMTFNWKTFSRRVKRQFAKVCDIGYSILDGDKLKRISVLGSELKRLYSTAVVCNKPGEDPSKCFPLDPDLTQIMAQSRDWEELVWAWSGWRNATGPVMIKDYQEFTHLQNDAARQNGFTDAGAFWRNDYEQPAFDAFVADVWAEVKPLYQELHAYVRRKLRAKYTDHTFPQTGHIPAHILGNMWAQAWKNIEPIVRPYPESSGVDVTDEMKKQGYDINQIFRLSENFFMSLGCDPMVENFWTDSMLAKPKNRKVVCHASAWDFYNQKNFRVKQCTEINMKWLITTHHEMGHVVYFMEYKNLPSVFRNGANPGFHEAIGDVLELSVSTPEHLNKIGLLPNFVDDEKVDMNFLMEMALRKIVFLPFGYLIDKWRWDLFANRTKENEFNKAWWELRCGMQGLSPPVARDVSGFDAGCKYHVPNNTPYIRYFISHILQFQLHQALCQAANHTGPLHRCDIYQSKAAGEKFRALMQLGSSMPWQDALEQVFGTRDLNVGSIKDYFKPLIDYLKEENRKNGERVGWDEACPDVH